MGSNFRFYNTFTPEIYQHLLDEQKMLTVTEFISRCNLSIESFQVQEYWNAWDNPARFMIVNRDMLEWLGYKGPLKEQRRNLLDIMKKNLRDDEFKIFFGGQLPTEVIGSVDEGRFDKVITITYPGLKKLSMMISTDRGNTIRDAYVMQELCFSLYIKYQRDFGIRDKQKCIDEANRNVLKLKVKNEKLKMKRHHPELTAGYCFYIHHNNEITIPDRFKIGKTKDIQQVLKSARRNSPYTLLDFIMYLDETSYDVVESAVKLRFISKRKPRPHEIVNASLREIVDAVIEICSSLKIEYSLGDQSQINVYNEFVIQETSANETDLGTEADDEKVETDEKLEKEECENENFIETPISQVIYNTTNITNNFNAPLISIEPSLEEALSLLGEMKNMTNAKLKEYLDKHNRPVGCRKENMQTNLREYLMEILAKHGHQLPVTSASKPSRKRKPEVADPGRRTHHPPAMDGNRQCSQCYETFHITKFAAKPYGFNGRDNACLSCRNEDKQKRRNELRKRGVKSWLIS